VWKLSEPAILAPARTLDRVLFALRRPLELPVKARDDGRIQRSELISLGASIADRISRALPL
jgi:hypothetical protein